MAAENPPTPKPGLTLLSSAEVTRRTSISRTHVWRMCQQGTFPRPVRIDGRRQGWVEAEVDAWVASRIAARDREVTA